MFRFTFRHLLPCLLPLFSHALSEDGALYNKTSTQWTQVEECALSASSNEKNHEHDILYRYDAQGRVIRKYAADNSFDYCIRYFDNKSVVCNRITQEYLTREYDEHGNLLRETFPNGLSIRYTYSDQRLATVFLPDNSSIEYQYARKSLIAVVRTDPLGQRLYQHTYLSAGSNEKREELIGGLGMLQTKYYPVSKALAITSPHIAIQYAFNDNGLLLAKKRNGKTETFCYAPNNELARDPSEETSECFYDTKGRMTKKENEGASIRYVYDALDRLTHVQSDSETVEYTYDIFNRRLSKTVSTEETTVKEHFLYQGNNEIAVYDDNKSVKHLRVVGLSPHKELPIAIAIESGGRVFAPIYDYPLNIAALIDIENRTLVDYTSLDPFGSNLSELPYIPWVYATKHFDPEVNLVYFGARYYDPSLQLWTAPDPEEALDPSGLYTYVRNNPLAYIDPDGRFAIAIPIIIGGTISAEAITNAIFIGACVALGYEIGEYVAKNKKNNDNEEYKKPKKKLSDKERAKDPPSWADNAVNLRYVEANRYGKKNIESKYFSR